MDSSIPGNQHRSGDAIQRLARLAGIWALVIAGYLGTAEIGIRVSIEPMAISLFWPSSGVALAAVALAGPAAIPPLFLAAAWSHYAMGIGVPFALLAGGGAAAAAAAGAWLLDRFAGETALDRTADPAILLLMAALVSGGISGVTGAAAMAGEHGAIMFTEMWWVCWVAHFTGTAFITPLILVWGRRRDRLPPVTSEACLIVATILALAAIGYTSFIGGAMMETLSYAVFPGLIWAAVRLDTRITTTLLGVTAGIAITCTAWGHGPFAGRDPMYDLLSLHVHLTILAMTILVIMAATQERLRADRRSAENLAALAQAGRVSALGEMAAGLAHELNQPLAALKSYSQAAVRMADSGDAKSARDALTRIAAMADRAAAILQGIRGYIGGRGDRFEDIDPAASVREVIRLLSHDPVRRNVSIEINLADDLPSIHGAPVQLQQILVNLIRNACEAAGQGGTVQLCARTEPQGGLIITVDDDGPGLPDRADLFTPFASEKPDGLGLGLAISKRIAEAHGGTLTGDAGPLGGARMTLSLPAAPARALGRAAA